MTIKELKEIIKNLNDDDKIVLAITQYENYAIFNDVQFRQIEKENVLFVNSNNHIKTILTESTTYKV